jgi:uracil-DNA glycosylase family protein
MSRGPARSRPAPALQSSYSTLNSARTAAKNCHACDLWKHGTQTVFGIGTTNARVMLVGEQPGDKEDLEGKPFVGPAGALLDKALAEAGIDRKDTYVTNVVKHFKWEPRGKRRIHKKPNALQIAACRPWLDAELEIVKPDIVVCLGATAAQALLGRAFRVTRQRGQLLPIAAGRQLLATVHPSSILRAADAQARNREYQLFVQDLRVVTEVLPKMS